MARTLALPLTVGPSGSLVTLEQDSPADVAQAIGLLLTTPVGERAALPGYGLSDSIGEQQVDESEIAYAISTWDDRVSSVDATSIAQALASGVRGDVVDLTINVIGA